MRDLLPIICSGQASKGGRIQLIHGSSQGEYDPGHPTVGGRPPPDGQPDSNHIRANRSCKGLSSGARWLRGTPLTFEISREAAERPKDCARCWTFGAISLRSIPLHPSASPTPSPARGEGVRARLT